MSSLAQMNSVAFFDLGCHLLPSTCVMRRRRGYGVIVRELECRRRRRGYGVDRPPARMPDGYGANHPNADSSHLRRPSAARRVPRGRSTRWPRRRRDAPRASKFRIDARPATTGMSQALGFLAAAAAAQSAATATAARIAGAAALFVPHGQTSRIYRRMHAWLALRRCAAQNSKRLRQRAAQKCAGDASKIYRGDRLNRPLTSVPLTKVAAGWRT